MGLFDLLWGSKKQTNVEVIPDRVWMTTQAKLAGLANEVAQRSSSGTVAILLVAHFPDVLAQLEQLADQVKSDVPLQPVLADNLNKDLATSLNLDESAIIDMIVGERHLVPAPDERLEAFADELPCRCRISRHNSLEDPVMKVFDGEGVQDVLRKLGMTEDESVGSRMVTRSILKAQRKIAQQAAGNANAESADEWLKKNCPEQDNW